MRRETKAFNSHEHKAFARLCFTHEGGFGYVLGKALVFSPNFLRRVKYSLLISGVNDSLLGQRIFVTTNKGNQG